MIVTKKIADQYILKRGCWLIHEQPNGEFSMSYESLNWKEGMELFETREECEEEIARRIKARMKPGDCPYCYNKQVVQSEVDITGLYHIAGKYNSIYRCRRCLTVWYPVGEGQFIAYDPSVADYVLDWNSRNLKPPAEMKTALIENISSDKREGVYLHAVTLKNGIEHPCAIILLKDHPPERYWFDRDDLFFLDQVKEIKPSPYAYSFAISKKAWKERNFVYIRDVNTKEVFMFDSMVAMFMPVDFSGREFVLAKHEEEQYGSGTKTIAERDERGRPAHWYFKPPPEPIYIWGDR